MVGPRQIVRYLLAFFLALLVIIALRSSSDKPREVFGVPSQPQEPKPVAAVPAQPPPDSSPRTQWGTLKLNFPVDSYNNLPPAQPLDIPKIQHDFPAETEDDRQTREKRLKAVKEAFTHAWSGYKSKAWLKDEVAPLSGGYTDAFGGWAATLVDSLDTLWIMDLRADFDEAVKAVTQIDFSTCALESLNVFETTIRYMGGFLAAYDLSGRQELLDKAIELGELIYKSFDTPNHMPISRWDWQSALRGKPQQAQTNALIAEIGSLSLELTRLSQLTGDVRYYDAIARITDVLYAQQEKTLIPGLWPIMVDPANLEFTQGRDFTLGGMADSTYEYLPKEFMLLGGHVPQYREMYEKAIAAAKKHLMFRPMLPNNPDVLISGQRHLSGQKSTHVAEGQHLVCFAGGMVAIASQIFQLNDLSTARKLVDGCVWAYEATKKGIMPEIFRVLPCEDENNCTFDEDKWVKQVTSAYHSGGQAVTPESLNMPHGMTEVPKRSYLLRPEAIESVWIMYRITGEREWMEKGWRMFVNIEAATRTPIANAAIEDVTVDDSSPKSKQNDKMESFWTAETLKYFYLLFSETDVISLDDFVLNTEAHPLKRPGRG